MFSTHSRPTIKWRDVEIRVAIWRKSVRECDGFFYFFLVIHGVAKKNVCSRRQRLRGRFRRVTAVRAAASRIRHKTDERGFFFSRFVARTLSRVRVPRTLQECIGGARAGGGNSSDWTERARRYFKSSRNAVRFIL